MFDEAGFPRFESDNSLLPALCHFVYCSRAADGLNDAEVERIVQAAKRHNAVRSITGVLAFGSGVFFQWIEGPAVEMQRLIAALQTDARHHDFVPLDQGEERRERLYPNWEMEQVGPEDIRVVLQDALENSEDANNVAALKRIMEQFASGPLASLGRS